MKKSILVFAAATALATTLSVGSASAQNEYSGMNGLSVGSHDSPAMGLGVTKSNRCVDLGFLKGTLGIITKGPVRGFAEGVQDMTNCR
jgi:hypothetical protein